MPRARKGYERFLRMLPGKLGQLVRTVVSELRRFAVRTAYVVVPSRRRRNHLDLLLFAWDLDAEAVAKALTDAGVDPAQVLVVTNSDGFAPLRRIGCHFEYVPPPADFERRLPGQDRKAFLNRRVEDLLRSYKYKRLAVAGAADELREPLGKVAADVSQLEPA